MLSETAIKWAEARRISKRTLEMFGAASGGKPMPQANGQKVEVLALPYTRAGEVVNTKYRALSEKWFCMKEGGELRFFNLDSVLSGPKKIAYIFEGEMDALAAVEAGLSKDCVLSVPNGAPKEKSAEPDEQDRYRFVRSALEEGLLTVERIVIATDNDGPGAALRADLVAMLGAAKCWFLEWPAGVKDANDALLRWGAGELQDFLEGEPKPWPVDGLYRLSQVPEPPPIQTWQPGFPEWESKLLFAPGMLSVLTGHPGHGKTLMGMQLWFNVCREYHVRAAFASFETNAKPHHRRNVRQFYHSKPQANMTDAEKAEADKWNEEHFLWIAHPERRPNLKWFLDLAEVAVIRHGAKIVQIDPWNKLEWERPEGSRETDWIRDGLNDCLSFAKDFNAHVQILCHPSKNQHRRSREEHPELEDIAGSKHWDNIVDQGLSIWRPKVFDDGQRKTNAVLYHLKARFEELGYPCSLDLEYSLQKCRYLSTDYQKGWEQ